MTVDRWNHDDSYSNYLALLNAAFFDALAYKLHVRDSYKNCMKSFYGEETYDNLVESLYEKHLDDLCWDADVELDVLDELIADSKSNSTFDSSEKEAFFDATERMEDIRREHYKLIDEEDDKEGFELIVQKTGIREQKCVNIGGFECHFCEAKISDDEYIIVYQNETRISNIIDKEDEWKKFQHDLYYEDIKNGQSSAMVYIVYILDGDSNNIPIQVIESNKTYGRKYVFTEEETITFINGIVKTSHDEIGAVSPVQVWDRILREEHLTGCLTEAYASKKVEAYLAGQRFDADYVQEDDYSSLTHSDVPQIKWVKSLDTTGFRNFCFNNTVMEFGQINLFYGANGSGKTSVLEAIEYALTAEVRRVKDFKVKLPTDSYPRLSIYDKEAGVHTFTPGFSKKNSKEIERVWYGVPIGRTKTNLNENFNRFNAFDSEAAYKFIHESDNSEDTYASMFGNLMFGESVVDHEKKWQRFKKAFNDRYSELRSELSDARYWAEVYEQSLAHKSDDSKSEEIERGIIELKLLVRMRLPKATSDRYPKIMEEMTIVRKYVDILSGHHLDTKTFAVIESEVSDNKRKNLQYVKEKREKAEEITRIAEEIGEIKKKIFAEKEKQSSVQDRIDRVNVDIKNWTIVQNVLSHEDTIKLVNDLIEELTQIDRELYYISKIEQRTAVVEAVLFALDIDGLWQEVSFACDKISKFDIDEKGIVLLNNLSMDELCLKAKEDFDKKQESIKEQREKDALERAERLRQLEAEEERRQEERRKQQEAQRQKLERQKAEAEKRRAELAEKQRLEREKQDQEKRERDEAFKAALEDNFSQHDTQIRDAEGKRWIKCEFCGKIAVETEFGSYGGLGRVNLGTCYECSKNNPSVYEKLEQKIETNKKNYVPNICPDCGGQLRQKSGRFGSFMGCSNYPNCTYTRNIKGKK